MDILLHEVFAVITSSMVQCPPTDTHVMFIMPIPHAPGNIAAHRPWAAFGKRSRFTNRPAQRI